MRSYYFEVGKINNEINWYKNMATNLILSKINKDQNSILGEKKLLQLNVYINKNS